MHILEITIATPPLFHDHIWTEEVVFDNSRIKPHLGAYNRVNERGDELIKSIDKKGYIEDKCTAKTFRVVVLEYVQVRTRNTERRILGLLAIIDE